MADGNYSSSESTNACAGEIRKEIMLFGVRVVLDPMRKSVSLNNLSDYEQTEETPKIDGEDQNGEDKNKTLPGYVSADEAVPMSSSNGTRERKRGVPWTEEEHKLFLLGLQRVGKGDWKGISRNFVKSRTSTQVASHAQKYFLRRSNLNRRRRRSSLFDMTTDTVMPMKEDHVVVMQDNTSQFSSPAPGLNNLSMHQVTQVSEFSVVQASSGNNTASGNQSYGSLNRVDLVSYTFQSRPVPLSLNLSLASSNLNEPSSSSSSMHSAFNTIGVA